MSLLTNLISYWKLDEASGTRVDSHGTNHLTDHNSVGSIGGKIGSAADFERDNVQFLSCPDSPGLSSGDADWTFAAWVNIESMPALMAIAGKHDGASIAGSEWLLSLTEAPNRFKFEVYQGAGNTTSLTANTFGQPSASTWYYVIVWHDSVNNQLGISVNAGTPDTTSWSNGINDTSTDFALAALSTGSASFDGLLDEIGFWKRVLTSNERTTLYNSGNGLPYSQFAVTSEGSGEGHLALSAVGIGSSPNSGSGVGHLTLSAEGEGSGGATVPNTLNLTLEFTHVHTLTLEYTHQRTVTLEG